MGFNNIFYQFYFFMTYLVGFGQTVPLEKVSKLPKPLHECSGIEWLAPNQLLLINDSGQKPEVFVMDTLGKLQATSKLENCKNVDWEELTIDDNGHLYIADIGNNNNSRKNLKVYKLPLGNLSAKPEIIRFKYPDQKGFPPKKKNRNFDAEAIIHADDHLYIFTKNRTKPFDGWTYCYRLANKAGKYTAEKVDSFNLGKGAMLSYQITSADFDPKSRTLALLGHDKLWLFYDFPESSFFRGNHKVYYFNHVSQKEAISFGKQGRLWITDEKNGKTGGKLYKSRLPALDALEYTINFAKREVENQLTFELIQQNAKHVYWEIFSVDGQRELYGKVKRLSGENTIAIDVSKIGHGGFVLNIIVNGEPNAFKFTKPILLKTGTPD